MTVGMRAFAMLVLGILGVVVLTARAAAEAVPSAPDIEVFMREGCPACSAAKRFLDDLQRERPELRVIYSDVGQDPEALARLQALADQRRVSALGVPAFSLRGELHIGYVSADTTGDRLRTLLDRPDLRPEDREATGTAPAPDSIDVPLLGRLRLGELSLPAITLLLGLLDGLNPCAMWVLLFLLSLLVNLHDRRTMLLIGGTFVAVSGLVYFAFMAAWLNLFLLIGLSRVVQVILGGIAVLVGVINVKDGFALQRGPSLTIPESAKPGLYARVRRILRAESLPGAFIGVVALAALVNTIELLCTAGLPAVYTHILTLQQLPWWAYYGYLGLYNVAYMLDDSLMLVLAVITLSRRKLQETGGRWLKLVSGVVMLGLGVVLITHPEWLAG
ncbi:MAG TPA: glutaredoxin [Candidatus Tectomicrobia bacterium]|nr:glutaredoxin [Candidatus Tectomicrobia bacterium]